MILTNSITQQKIRKASPRDIEVLFDGGIMITETDLNGVITYANRIFLDITGYSEKELIGMPHSINRHPDMPESIFEKMWKVIKNKKIWRGYLKNMTRDGKYYWVIVWIQPKFDEKKNIVGYIASRKIPYRSTIEKIERNYLSLPKEKRDKISYPYGKELSFGSDFIGSKHLDLKLDDRLNSIVADGSPLLKKFSLSDQLF